MSRARPALAFLLVLALAVALRFPGIGWLLPSLVEPDAHIAVQVELIERGDPHPSETVDYGKYPHLVAWTTIALTPTPVWGSLPADAPLERHLELAAARFSRVRVAVAFLSLLALPATWILARLYLPAAGALVATWLAATSLLGVHFATQGRPHGAAVGFFGFALVACVLVRRRPDWRSYAIAAAACGLCLGTLQSGVAVYLALAAAHLLAGPLKSRRHLLLLLPAAGFALALALFYPFWVFGAPADGGRVALEGGRIDQAGHLIMLDRFNGRGLSILARALVSWEPVLAVGLLAGVALWLADRLRRRPGGLAARDQLVVLAFALPYALVIALYQRSYERFLLPLLPLLCALTAWGLWRLARAAAGWRPLARGAAAGVALLALGAPAVVATALVSARTAPTTFDQAAAWVREAVAPETERVALTMPLQLPLFRTPAALAEERLPPVWARTMEWLRYQTEALGGAPGQPAWDLRWMPMQRPEWRAWAVREPLVFLRSLEARWALIEVFGPGRVDPSGAAIRAGLGQLGELRARFAPDRDATAEDAPLAYQDETGGRVPWMAARVLRARRTGPVLEAWRLPERGLQAR